MTAAEGWQERAETEIRAWWDRVKWRVGAYAVLYVALAEGLPLVLGLRAWSLATSLYFGLAAVAAFALYTLAPRRDGEAAAESTTREDARS